MRPLPDCWLTGAWLVVGDGIKGAWLTIDGDLKGAWSSSHPVFPLLLCR
jgi:hypothetical protein